MKMHRVTHRKGARKKWRESWCVWLDFIGDRSQIGPLLDHIAGELSGGGGSFLALPLSDQSWEFTDLKKADEVFNRLKAACHSRWTPYARLRLMHESEPPPPLESKAVTRKGKKVTLFFNKRSDLKGPRVLRKYQRGKCPDLKVALRPPPKKRKTKRVMSERAKRLIAKMGKRP